MKQDENLWSGVINIETIKKWCGMSNNKLALIFPSYDIIDHFNFYGISSSDLQETLGIEHLTKNNRKRLLVFNALRSVLLIIRVTTNDTLKDEINRCVADVNLLSLMLRDELERSGVIVTALLVYLEYNTCLLDQCLCRDLIVSKEVFDSEKNIDLFWNNYEKRIRHYVKKELSLLEKSKLFMDVCCKLLPYLAQYQYQVSENPILPTNRADPTNSIEETLLLLDRYQMEIVNSNEKRIILKGNYGTGKSILCVRKIEFLARTLTEKDAIYYINFHGRSELDCIVKKKIKGLHPNINVIKGNYTLSNTIKSEILEKEKRNGANDVHLIVDEYNAETLTKSESSTLVKLFTEDEQLKNSTILIALQPIKIDRVEFHYINGKENEYSETGNMFHELKKIMTVKHLRHVMRTTTVIDTFIKITQEYVNKKSNTYTRHRENNEILVKPSSSTKINVKKLSNTDKKESLIALENLQVNRNTNLEMRDPENRSAEIDMLKVEAIVKYESTQINSKLVPSSNSLIDPISKKINLFSNSVDFDGLQKLTHTGPTINSENSQKIVTTYQYFGESSVGHNISGPTPKVIKMLSLTALSELAVMIAMCFKILEEGTKRTVFIHFEQGNPLWLEKILSLQCLFPHLLITSDIEYFFSSSNEKLVLIKNYNFVTGQEFPNVAVLLDANEYHLKQFIPGAMARCQKNLAIVIKSLKDEILEDDTVANLLDHWENLNTELEETNSINETFATPVLSMQFQCFV